MAAKMEKAQMTREQVFKWSRHDRVPQGELRLANKMEEQNGVEKFHSMSNVLINIEKCKKAGAGASSTWHRDNWADILRARVYLYAESLLSDEECKSLYS
jgi:hypothetical protein